MPSRAMRLTVQTQKTGLRRTHLPRPLSLRRALGRHKPAGTAVGGSLPVQIPHPSQTVRTDEMLWLETLLFLSREPLSAKRLASLMHLKSPARAAEIVTQLNRMYDEQRYVFRVLDFAGGYQLRTRPQFTPWLRRLCHQDGHQLGTETPEIRLSPPAMETLAIIAYRQPIVRAEIESLRGVQCGEILRQLLGRDLIRIAGRSDELGRPFLYETTRKFLEIFGLKSLAQLPAIRHTEPKDENVE